MAVKNQQQPKNPTQNPSIHSFLCLSAHSSLLPHIQQADRQTENLNIQVNFRLFRHSTSWPLSVKPFTHSFLINVVHFLFFSYIFYKFTFYFKVFYSICLKFILSVRPFYCSDISYTEIKEEKRKNKLIQCDVCLFESHFVFSNYRT